MSGNTVQFQWCDDDGLVKSFGVGVVVECSVQLETLSQSPDSDETSTRCLVSPVRVREKSVANTVYVISRTLENVVEGLTLEDVCKLLGISERGPAILVPEIEVETAESMIDACQDVEMGTDTAMEKQDSFGPISPGRVSDQNPTCLSQEFYRPGSPMLSRSHQTDAKFIDPYISHPMGLAISSTCPFFRPGSPKVSERDDGRGKTYGTDMNFGVRIVPARPTTPSLTTSNEDDVLEIEIVLPQEVPEVHSMENDPLFTVVD